MPACNSEGERALVAKARAQITIYEDMAELIRLGAYRAGTNAEVDGAIRLYPKLEAFLSQEKEECSDFHADYGALDNILRSAAKGDAR